MTTPASHYHCVFMGPFVYTLHFTWKMVHYSTLMSGRQPGHRDGEAGKRGLAQKPKHFFSSHTVRSYSSASTLTTD